MDKLIRVAVGAVGVLNLVLGLLFLVAPRMMAAEFFIEPIGSQGLATIRADFPGFFLTAGVFALWGASARRGDLLRVPFLLLATALFGRIVSLLFDGIAATAFPPMIAEILMLAILYAGMRQFAKPA